MFGIFTEHIKIIFSEPITFFFLTYKDKESKKENLYRAPDLMTQWGFKI
jgi:hypothetical protein